MNNDYIVPSAHIILFSCCIKKCDLKKPIKNCGGKNDNNIAVYLHVAWLQ